ncbi:GntR family transcriptional regulator [Yinghuangia aomiensis]|uniref:GntR family transcriptional regulator n=1 Tax=Yinghuangia aomiensis TaxID=676205 RepID=A0ABP9I5D7_9ACTN
MSPTTPGADGLSASERAYAFIRERLFDGTYAGGMMLSEGEIAEAAAVSRTPVHEALLRCEFEGHVRLYAKRGALVLPVTVKEIQDVLTTRRLIETYAVEYACESGHAGSQLLAAVDRQAELLTGGEDDKFSAADDDFHRGMVSATGNALLVKAYALAKSVPLRIPNRNMRTDPGRAAQVIEEHRAIAEAVAERDVAAARAAVATHLDHAMTSLLRAL